MSDSAANSTAPPDGSSPPPGGESSKPAIPPSTKLDDNSPPSKSSPSPPSSELGSPPPSSPPPNSPPPPLQSPPPSSSDSSPPPPSHPPPLSKSPPSSESPATSPPPAPTPPRAPPVASPPPPSSSVSPPPAVFLPPPNSSKASPPPPHAETPSTAPPPPGVTPSPPVPGAVIQPPPPPVTESITPPTPPATDVQPNTPGLVPPPPTEILLTPPGSDSPPVRGGSPSDLSSPASSDAKSSNTPSTPPEKNGEISSTKVVAGGVVAAAVLLGLIALFFAVRGRRKRQKPYASHYMPPSSFTVNTDGFYYGHTRNSMGFSGNHSYGSQPRHSAAYGDSFGSQMGNANSGGLDSGVISSSKSFFAYDEVMEMTNGFARQNIIGEGGFGCVYKGWMPDGRVVAVKQLKAGSGQGDREFKAEVEIISRVHHRHLVSLVGYSISDRQRMLIYEFVPNNTLEHHLHAQGLQVLDWPKRLKIAIGSAKGLAYLHEDCHPKIIHRDIKSANILLDDDFEAQVADFGLARLNDTTQTHVSTRVMGTFGYLAPEYASSGKLTDRSDVYSFGVVLLELITGRKPVDPTQPLGDESLVEWARPQLAHAVETGNLSELVDPRLEKHYVESEMFRMVETAAACVRHSAPKRPRMVQVVRALDCDSEMSDLSNGVKYGQSKTYDSGLYNEEIMKFRRMALGSRESSEFNTSSEGYTSNDSETRAMNQRSVDRRHFAGQSNYDNRHF